MPNLILVLSLVLSLVACSSSDKTKEASASSSSEVETSSAAALKTSDPKAPAAYDSPDDLVAGVPADAHFCAGVPGLEVLKTAAGPAFSKEMYDQGLAAISAALHLPDADLKKVLESFDGGLVFGRRNGSKATIGALMHFSSIGVVAPLLEAAKFKKEGSDRYSFKEGETGVVVVLLEKRNLAIVAQEAVFIDEIMDTLAGKKPSFESSVLREKHAKQALWAVADLAALVPEAPEYMAKGSRVSFVAGLDGKGSRLDFRELGAKVPRLGNVLAPSDHAFAGRAPVGMNTAILVSTKRAAGKTLRDVLAEITRAATADVAVKLEEALKPAGVSVDELERALGDELVLGFFAPNGTVPGLEMMQNGAFVLLLETREEAVVRRLIDFAAKQAGPGSSPGKLKADIGNGMAARAETSKGATIIAIGGPKFVNQAVDDFAAGKPGLGSAQSFIDARKRAAPASNIALYIDAATLAQLSATPIPGFNLDFDLSLVKNDEGAEVAVVGNGSVAILGTMSALAVYGVRRYIENAKAADNKLR